MPSDNNKPHPSAACTKKSLQLNHACLSKVHCSTTDLPAREDYDVFLRESVFEPEEHNQKQALAHDIIEHRHAIVVRRREHGALGRVYLVAKRVLEIKHSLSAAPAQVAHIVVAAVV